MVERMGNTSAASIPLVLKELVESGKSRDGDIALLSTFGAGIQLGECCSRTDLSFELGGQE